MFVKNVTIGLVSVVETICNCLTHVYCRFVEAGGWDVLNNWLQESKEHDNHPVMLEILKVYQALPVTVEMLKKNNAAKTIKQLGKSNDNESKNKFIISHIVVQSVLLYTLVSIYMSIVVVFQVRFAFIDNW